MHEKRERTEGCRPGLRGIRAVSRPVGMPENAALARAWQRRGRGAVFGAAFQTSWSSARASRRRRPCAAGPGDAGLLRHRLLALTANARGAGDRGW